MQVTPSVTPTSSLSSGDTRSTYANNVTRGTPNSRGSVDAGHSDVAAAAMRGSLALDPGLFSRRNNYSPAAAVAATYDAARRANPYSVYQRRPEHFEHMARGSVASAASSGEAVVPPSAAMGEHWPKSATLRPIGQHQQQQARASGQFHNMVHLQNPMAAAMSPSNGLYTFRRNSLHEFGGGGAVGAGNTGSLMRCTTTNGSGGSLQKVKRVYI